MGRVAPCDAARPASPLCCDRRSGGAVSARGSASPRAKLHATARWRIVLEQPLPAAWPAMPGKWQRGHVPPPVAALCVSGTSPLRCDRSLVISVSGQGGVPPWPSSIRLSREVRCSVVHSRYGASRYVLVSGLRPVCAASPRSPAGPRRCAALAPARGTARPPPRGGSLSPRAGRCKPTAAARHQAR